METAHTGRIVESFSVLDNLTANERERLRKCEASLEVSLGVLYGERLATITTEALVREVALDPRVFRFVVTGDTSEIDPDNRSAFKIFAREMVEANEIAVRNLEFSNATRKAELAKQFLESLKPTQRLAFERDGSLTARTEQYVENKLDDRDA